MKKSQNLFGLWVGIMGIKQFKRRKRVIELRCRGWTEVQIASFLGVSERTIRRDLKSAQANEFVEELKRRQLEDIEENDDSKVRLKYRDKILDKLLPKQVRETLEGGRRPIIIEIWKPEEE